MFNVTAETGTRCTALLIDHIGYDHWNHPIQNPGPLRPWSLTSDKVIHLPDPHITAASLDIPLTLFFRTDSPRQSKSLTPSCAFVVLSLVTPAISAGNQDCGHESVRSLGEKV